MPPPELSAESRAAVERGTRRRVERCLRSIERALEREGCGLNVNVDGSGKPALQIVARTGQEWHR